MIRHLTMVMAFIAAIYGCHSIGVQNQQIQREVYSMLDQDSITPEQRERINLILDDEVDPIFLDESHQQRYKYHFGEQQYTKRFVWKAPWK